MQAQMMEWDKNLSWYLTTFKNSMCVEFPTSPNLFLLLSLDKVKVDAIKLIMSIFQIVNIIYKIEIKNLLANC